MKKGKEKIIFVVLATLFAISLFVVSVVATLRPSAQLSGLFNFSVPETDFFFLIEASAEGSKDPVMPLYHKFDNQNTIGTITWDLNGLNFKENNLGEIEDIVFSFRVTNENTTLSETRSGRVKITYESVNVDEKIVLTPSENLENGIELEALLGTEDESQINNKAEFSVALSSINKIPTSNLEGAQFQYKLIFEFV